MTWSVEQFPCALVSHWYMCIKLLRGDFFLDLYLGIFPTLNFGENFVLNKKGFNRVGGMLLSCAVYITLLLGFLGSLHFANFQCIGFGL